MFKFFATIPYPSAANSVIENVFSNKPTIVGNNNTRFTSFIDIASILLNFIIGMGFSLSIIAITFSAIMYTMSEGDPEKTKKAWTAFINGVIAAAISIGAIAIKTIVVRAFGVTDANILDVPTF